MPGLTSLSPFSIAIYSSPSSFPTALWDIFVANESNANIMYPHALKTARRELAGDSSTDQFWITLSSRPSPDSDPVIDLVLSCTAWALGTYPVFIFATVPFASLTPTWLNTRILLLAERLQDIVPIERVYSVFAPSPISKAFARTWHSLTGATAISDPYYAASFSFCTRQTFRNRRHTILPGTTYELRKATEADIPAAAHLCKGFASTSEPFVLDDAGALHEATELIRTGQLWVHEMNVGNTTGLASIVAVTRQSEGVSAITKVYTNPAYRKQGCAERLVRYVCKRLLLEEHKKKVVLFVAHNNVAAATVYDRVGFAGLCGKPKVDGVDPWVEIGFENTELGHW